MGRSRKVTLLVAAMVLAAAVVGITQWGGAESATALLAPAEGSAPSVKLTATPSSVAYPTIVTLTAVASNVDTTVARFEVRSADSDTWAPLDTVISATGQFAYNYFPKKNSYYRVFVGSAESTPAVYVPVHTRLSKPCANATTLRVGQTLRLWGTIRPYHPVGDHPADVKYALYWEKYDSSVGKWKPAWATPKSISGVVDNDTTKWTHTHKVMKAGLWRVRFYHECPRHTKTYSSWRTFRVVN